VVPSIEKRAVLDWMAITEPLQKAQFFGAKFPPNMRISPIIPSMIFFSLSC
jgi:hypothetical protein